jgi:hypothetical protein
MGKRLGAVKIIFPIVRLISFETFKGRQIVKFLHQKSQFEVNYQFLIMENVGIFYGHLEYFTAIWYIFGLFDNVVVIWYIFHVLVYCVKKNLATL